MRVSARLPISRRTINAAMTHFTTNFDGVPGSRTCVLVFTSLFLHAISYILEGLWVLMIYVKEKTAKITCGQSPMTEVLIINTTTQGVKTPCLIQRKHLLTVFSSSYLTVCQQFDPSLVDKRLHSLIAL